LSLNKIISGREVNIGNYLNRKAIFPKSVFIVKKLSRQHQSIS